MSQYYITFVLNYTSLHFAKGWLMRIYRIFFSSGKYGFARAAEVEMLTLSSFLKIRTLFFGKCFFLTVRVVVCFLAPLLVASMKDDKWCVREGSKFCLFSWVRSNLCPVFVSTHSAHCTMFSFPENSKENLFVVVISALLQSRIKSDTVQYKIDRFRAGITKHEWPSHVRKVTQFSYNCFKFWVKFVCFSCWKVTTLLKLVRPRYLVHSVVLKSRIRTWVGKIVFESGQKGPNSPALLVGIQ